MKQLFIVCMLILATLSAGYSFNIENSQGDEVQFFSSSHPILTLTSKENGSVTFHYTGENQTNKTSNFTLNECDDNYCYQFSGLTYTQYENSFNVSIDNKTKTITKDDINPQLQNVSTTLNEEKKQLEIQFTPFDNSNNINYVELYKKKGGDYIFVKDLTNKTNYTYKLESSQEAEFLFKLQDQALNTYEQSKFVDVEDIFPPILNDFKLIKSVEGTFSLFISAEDEALKRYSIYQESLFLGEDISGEQLNKTVDIPFKKGTITLEIIDDEENIFQRNISLKSKISVSSFSSSSNSMDYKFVSNAQKCVLTKLNGNDKSIEFSKDGNDFSKKLGFKENQKNSLEIYCEKENYREYFTKSITIDTKNPEDVELEVEQKDDGSLFLSWSDSEDNLGEVEYNILRNGNTIDTTSKTSFKDSAVTYPNSYSYEIQPIDEAGNKAKSNEIKKTPLKVAVQLQLSDNSQETIKENSTNLKITTEKDANISVVVKQNGKTTHQNNLVASSSSMNLNVPLTLGVNEIILTAVDSLGNTKKVTKTVIVEEEQVEGVELEPTQEPQQQNTTTTPTISNPSEPESESDGGLGWWWLLIFLVLLGIFVWAFIFNEEKLRKLAATHSRKSAIYHRKRKDDEMLGRSLKVVRQKRIQKQQEEKEKKRREEERRKKEDMIKTQYQQKKHEDISHRNKKDFAVQPGKENKKKKIIPTEKQPHEVLEKPQEPKPSLKEKFLSRKKQEPPKEDSFGAYLAQKTKTGWDNPHAYKQSYHEKKEQERREKEEAKRKELEQKQYEQQLEASKKQQESQKPLEQPKEKKSFFKRKEKPQKNDKLSLDDYLSKRTKKKRFYFAEKEVERNLRNR